MDDKITISDLLDAIHYTIIKHYGVNEIILDELQKINEKIQGGELANLKLVGVPYWESLKKSL